MRLVNVRIEDAVHTFDPLEGLRTGRVTAAVVKGGVRSVMTRGLASGKASTSGRPLEELYHSGQAQSGRDADRGLAQRLPEDDAGHLRLGLRVRF